MDTREASGVTDAGRAIENSRREIHQLCSMHITKVELKNFKRFTNLTIDGIPTDAKLVLLIGSNGSGKSSVFDAFEIDNSRQTIPTFRTKNGRDKKQLIKSHLRIDQRLYRIKNQFLCRLSYAAITYYTLISYTIQ